MIELSILDLLYLVLTFFLVIVGTLFTLVLLRVLKILKVWVEISDIYWQVKKTLGYYSKVPQNLKDKAVNYFNADTANIENDFNTGFEYAQKTSKNPEK